MESIHGFDFGPLQTDRQGRLKSGADELAAHVKDHAVTDVLFLCHGFRNDEHDARRLYTNFLASLAAGLGQPSLSSRLAGRTFAVGGMFWPSMVLPEPNDAEGAALAAGDPSADARGRLERLRAAADPRDAVTIDVMLQDLDRAPHDDQARRRMAEALIALAGMLATDERRDANEVSTALARTAPDQLCTALMADTVDVTAPGTGAGGAVGIPRLGGDAQDVQGLSVFDSVFGFVPRFVNLTTFLLMFERCGDVGARGISGAVRRVRAAAAPRIHLVGHSLGGRAVTACAKALLDDPPVPVATLLLLQAAYSHFGLSAGATATSPIKHPRGFFRDIIDRQAVTGPILATHSKHDHVVALAYTPMAAIIFNNARAIGDEHSPFGGIGRNGVLDTREAEQLELQQVGVPYAFRPGAIHNLDGSRVVDGVPLIGSHGDVTSPAIGWACASLLATA